MDRAKRHRRRHRRALLGGLGAVMTPAASASASGCLALVDVPGCFRKRERPEIVNESLSVIIGGCALLLLVLVELRQGVQAGFARRRRR